MDANKIFNPERIMKLRSLSKESDIYALNKGILLQLFGGPNIEQQSHSKTKTIKFIQELYIYCLVPRAQYTSGKGSSAVGLTAFNLFFNF